MENTGEEKLKGWEILKKAFPRLSRGECEILAFLTLTGDGPEQVAQARGTAVNTVRSQIATMQSKLGVNNLRKLVLLAQGAGAPAFTLPRELKPVRRPAASHMNG